MKTSQNHLKQSVKLAMPMVLAQLIRMGMSIIGVYMVSRLGIFPLAASGLAASYFLTILLFGFGCIFSVTIFMGHASGAKNREEMCSLFVNGIWYAVLLAIPIAIITWKAPSILLLFGQKPEIVGLTHLYFDIMFFVVFLSLLCGCMQQVFIALHRARINYILSIITLIVSVFIFYLTIWGRLGVPSFGVAGIAMGYLVGNIVTLIVGLVYLSTLDEFKGLPIFKNILKVDFKKVNKLFQTGWPVGTSMMLELAAMLVIVWMLGYLGHVALASYQIVWQMVLFALMIPIGFSQAVSAIISRLQGAGDHEQIRSAGKANVLLGVSLMIFLAIVYVVFSTQLIHIFISKGDVDEVQVVYLAKHMLYISAVVMIFDSMRLISTGALRGLRDVKKPLLFSILGYWVLGVPLAIILGFGLHFGAVGLWSGIGVATVILGPSLFIRFMKRA